MLTTLRWDLSFSPESIIAFAFGESRPGGAGILAFDVVEVPIRIRRRFDLANPISALRPVA